MISRCVCEILDRLIVRRAIETCAQKIGLAHVERIETAFARDCVHDALDGDHALRAAEAAKGGVGDGVGLEAAGQDRNVGQPIAVAGVKHRAVADAGRQIRGTAAAGVERHFVTGDHALVVVTHSPIGAEIVALAGQGEIIVAIEADLARLARHSRGKRRDRRPGAGLAFLAAKAAAHPPRLYGDESVGYSEDAGDDVLGLRRVLRRDMHHHLVAFAGKGEGRLALEIEMLLAADRELAIQPVRGLLDRGRRVAAPERIVVLNSRAADKRIRDRDRRRSRLDVDLGEPRRPARLVARARDDCEQEPGRGTSHLVRRTEAHRRKPAQCRSCPEYPPPSEQRRRRRRRGPPPGPSSSVCREALFAMPIAICSVPAGSPMSST